MTVAVMAADDLTDDENWTGGFYELCLVMGVSDDGIVDRALRDLWLAAGVEGCYVRQVGARELTAVEVSSTALHEHGHLRGTLALPSGPRMVCGALLFRYDGVDTLELYLPLGALARVDPRIGGFPFDQHSGVESLTWRAGLDGWLAAVAKAVHSEVPLRRAFIGFEVDVDPRPDTDRRHVAVLEPGTDGLEYLPAQA